MEILFDTKGNEKQKMAAAAWIDSVTDEILFGGAKYGGKSYLGCSLIFGDALLYPGTQYFIARKDLTDLRKFTVPSVYEVFNAWGLKAADYMKFNGQDNFFLLHNTSKVFLIDAKHEPSDPFFHRFGSIQMTRGWCEEIGEIPTLAIQNLKLTVGRWKNAEYGLKKKLLLTCNPHKGYGYNNFYKPSKDGTLPESRKFIVAFPQDNKSGDPDYIESLKNNPNKSEFERLYKGNWEYDDDPARLFEYDNLVDMFTNTGTPGEKYLSVDVARHGKDKTVIVYWNGWQIKKIWIIKKSGLDFVVETLGKICAKLQIQRSHVIVDEDGVGGGVVDTFKGCKGFLNNGRPIVTKKQKRLESKELFVQNYTNLKSQCYFYLATQVDRGTIGIDNVDDDVKEFIVEELAVVKQKDIDKENKLAIISKEDMKEILGRSPDFADAIMMRAYFDLRPQSSIKIHLV